MKAICPRCKSDKVKILATALSGSRLGFCEDCRENFVIEAEGAEGGEQVGGMR